MMTPLPPSHTGPVPGEPSPVNRRLKDGIVGVLDGAGRVVGTGFMLDQRLVLTCAHVIVSAGGSPGQRVSLRFEVDRSPVRALVDPDGWSPREQDDLALLRLEGDAPAAAAPLELKAADHSNGHTFHTFGYPRMALLDGLGAIGTIIDKVRTRAGRSLLQLESNQVDSGFSGAPIWDQELLKVVGMLQSAINPADTGRLDNLNLAIPADTLLSYLPELSARTTAALANPFYIGGAVPPDAFVGRAGTLRLIQSRLGSPNPQSVSIVGARRMGKSSLLRYVCTHVNQLFPAGDRVVIFLDLMKAYTQTRHGFMSALRQELAHALGCAPWEADQDGNLEALSFAFEKLAADGVRLVLCLDEIECLTQRKEQFDDLLEELRAAASYGQISMLTASACPLADLARGSGLTSPFYNIFVQETLGPLEEAEWRQLVQDRMPGVTPAELSAIYHLAGGHPFYTQLAAARLWEAHFAAGDPDWQAQALEDLVPHWAGWWGHLTPQEKAALRFAAGLSPVRPADSLLRSLGKRGLLRQGSPFSAAFAEWLEGLE